MTVEEERPLPVGHISAVTYRIGSEPDSQREEPNVGLQPIADSRGTEKRTRDEEVTGALRLYPAAYGGPQGYSFGFTST